MKNPIFRVPLGLLAALVIAACSDDSAQNPVSPSQTQAEPSAESGTLVTALHGKSCKNHHENDPECDDGGNGGGGGGGGTATDFTVEMVQGGISWDPEQEMQAKRDNKKALAAEGTINGVKMSFDSALDPNPLQCTWTGQGSGTFWTHPSVKALRHALGDLSLVSEYGPLPERTRAVNFQINHNGDLTGTGAIRLLSVPEGQHPWLSYCFNTGKGLCRTVETNVGDVRTFTFSGSAVRAVHNGVELVCRVSGTGATIQVTPK